MQNLLTAFPPPPLFLSRSFTVISPEKWRNSGAGGKSQKKEESIHQMRTTLSTQIFLPVDSVVLLVIVMEGGGGASVKRVTALSQSAVACTS